MSETLPPATSTARPLRRLRATACALAVIAFAPASLFPASPASSRPPGAKVLVSAPVSDAAAGTMPAALWAKIVADFIDETVAPFAGAGAPTVEDCRKAGADYVVVAPFDLRPRLPGLPYAMDRTPAQTHLTVTNCLTSDVVFDRTIVFDSDPQGNQPAGDFDAVPEVSWSRSVPAALHPYAFAFPRIARIVRIDPPFAYVDVDARTVKAGQGLRDFARADRTLRTPPLILTAVDTEGKYVQAQFSAIAGATLPSQGDLVEPMSADAPATRVPAASPPPSPGPSPLAPASASPAPPASPTPSASRS